MKKLIALIIAIAPFFTFGQLSTEENYVKSTTYRTAVQDGAQATVIDTDKIEGVTYYDGIGRPKQSIAVKQGGNQENTVMHYEYDRVGRQAKSYLPFAQTAPTQELVANPLQSTLDFYNTTKYENTTNPYSETRYDYTSLSRTVEQSAPGEDWKISNGHTVKAEYLSNTEQDAVLDFDVVFENNDLSQPKLVYKGVFEKNKLYKYVVKDENWKSSDVENKHTTHQYSDVFGRTILTRSFTKATDSDTGITNYIPVDTYNVYDDYGNLTYTISPKGTDAILASTTYTDFAQPQLINGTDLMANLDTLNGESGSFTINLVGDQLTLNIDPFVLNSQKYLETGMIIPLSQPMPDVFIGTFGVMGSDLSGGFGYEFSIESGALVINGGGLVSQTDLTGSFTTTIPSLQVDLDVVNDLGYQYKYDVRGRLIERKVPGAGWEYIVYDKLNRPVLTQDAKLQEEGKWLFVKYDIYNRTTYTGKYTSSLNRTDLQSILNNQSTFNETKTTGAFLNDAYVYYSNGVFPTTVADIEVLSMNYYDSYDFMNSSSIVTGAILGQDITTNTKNLALGSSVRILGTSKFTHSVIYYDEKARPIYTTAENSYLNTQDQVSILYDFVGNALKTDHRHTIRQNFELSPGIFVPKTDIVRTIDNFTYDHQNRMLTHYQEILNGTGVTVHGLELLEKNTYDELGRVTQVAVGNNELSPLQQVDYAYNIRGWLKSINNPHENLVDDIFALQIGYNTITLKNDGSSKLNTEALYNGNISEITYKTASDHKKRAYGYQYDNLNRLEKARYKAGDNLNDEKKYYDLVKVKYDKNGNIKKLKRNAPTADFSTFIEIDNLQYRYEANTNVLKKVNDNPDTSVQSAANGFEDGNTVGRDYYYDVNGNLIQDKNKNIENITYNYLNLPETMTVTGVGVVNFVYDASGVKQEKTVTHATNGTHKTGYSGKFIYSKQFANGASEPIYELEFFNTSQGYVEPMNNSTLYSYVYQYKDHQGNIRASYSDADNDGHIDIETLTNIDADGDGNIENELVKASNYYPYGLDHTYAISSPMSVIGGRDHKWKYNGQEQLKDLGINVTEMTFRQYDNALGRFHGIDRLAAMYPNITPYHFANNNPIYFSDPSGLTAIAGDWDSFVDGAINLAQFGSNSDVQAFNNTFGVDFQSAWGDYISSGQSFSNYIAAIGGGGGGSGGYYTQESVAMNWIERQIYLLFGGEKTANWFMKTVNTFHSYSDTNLSNNNPFADFSDPWGDDDTGITLSNGNTLAMGHDGVVTIGAGNNSGSGNTAPGLSWATPVGVGLIGVTIPSPKRFVARNSSHSSSIFSKYMSKTKWGQKKINFRGKRRLYTHTLNSSKRYASTWGRYVGRWGSRILGPIGWILLAYDITNYMSEETQKIVNEQYDGDFEAYRKDVAPYGMKCFIAGTKITMANDKFKNIEDIKVGEIVKTYNVVENKIENNVVLEIETPIHDDLVEIDFGYNIQNTNTFDHPYYVKDKGWCSYKPLETKIKYGIETSQLKVGDICYLYKNGTLVEIEITNIKENIRKERTYNLSKVANNHNFFANGILVHNKGVE